MEQDTIQHLAKIVRIARVCHEVNRAYCMALGDHSQVSWDEAPEWQRQSTSNGVLFFINHPAAPNVPVTEFHNNWLAEKEAAGWMYGPEKDVVKKQHPCFLPFAQLPLPQQAKDYIFCAIVRELYE